MRTLVKQFDQELKSQINGRMIDGRIASKLLTLLKDIQTQIGSTRALVTRFESRQGDRCEGISSRKRTRLG